MFRRVATVVAAVVVVLAGPVVLAGAGTESVTIGEVGGPGRNYNCGGETDLVQVSAAANYVVPAGAWSLASWSHLTGTGDPPDLTPADLQLEVWRATAVPGDFVLVGISPPVTTTPPGLNTFPLASPIAVQGGDILGLRSSAAFVQYGCQRRAPGAFGSAVGPVPTPGDTRTFTIDAGGVDCCVLNVAAVLERTVPDPVVVTPSFTG